MRYFSLLLMFVLFTGGCSMNSASGIRSQSNSYQMKPVERNVSYSGRWLNVVSVQSASAEAVMSVVADVQSLAVRDKKFSYRVIWFDNSGRLIDTVLSRWQERLIKPSQILTLSAQAPTQNAVEYRVEIMDK